MKETKQKTASHLTPNPLINYQFYYRLPANVDDSHRLQISVCVPQLATLPSSRTDAECARFHTTNFEN
jgi:hypothetical protein